MTFEVFGTCNLYLYFFIFSFCIKNKWRLHTTYPKSEVPLKAPQSLFWENPISLVSYNRPYMYDYRFSLLVGSDV